MKVLVVEDDLQLASILALTLRQAGYLVLQAYDGATALRLWADEAPDLVILDLNLPAMDGFEVCRRIRSESDVPIVMLTVRGAEDDVVHGLELGADDYITKPFSPRALVARIKAVMRRAQRSIPPDVLEAGGLVLDPVRREVRRGDEPPIRLTALEYRLLHYLMVNRGHPLTAETLIYHIWGYRETGDRALLRQLVYRLRQKIEDDPAVPLFIETVPGVGYLFDPPIRG